MCLLLLRLYTMLSFNHEFCTTFIAHCSRYNWESSVTRTSTSSMAPIHFPSRPHFLPIPGGLRAHTHAIPILVDRTLSLPILVVFPLIIPFTSLYYSCLPDPRLASPMPSQSTRTVKVVLKGNGSKGLRPQLVRCAPFPSIAPYFRMLWVSYPKIRMTIVAYLKVRTTIVWYPGVEESNVFLSEDKE